MSYIAFAARIAEGSTSVGTGPMVLSAAMTGYKRFNSITGIIVGDTLPYYIVGADNTWEHGVGTYSAANTLTRPATVIAGSNGTAPVNFAAGSKNVFFGDPGVATLSMADPAPTPNATDKVGLWNSLSNKFNSLSMSALSSWIGSAVQELSNKTIKNPANASQILADASNANALSVLWDVSLGQTALLTTTAQTNRFVANPTNLKIGGVYTLIVTQGVANQTITSWGSVFNIIGDYTLSPTAGSTTMFYFVYDGTKLIGGVMNKGVGVVTSTPTPTPAPPAQPTFTTAKMQAEDGTISGTGAVVSTTSWMGPFEGSYVGDFTDINGAVTFNTPYMSAGQYALTLKIVTFNVQTNGYQINGGPIVRVDMPATQLPFQDFVINNVALNTGVNVIKVGRLDAQCSGNFDLDYISLLQTSASAPTPAPSPTPAPPTGSPLPPASYPLPNITFGTQPDGAPPNGIQPSTPYATRVNQLKALYDQWKAARIRQCPAFVATDGVFAGQQITDAYYVSCEDSNSIWVKSPTYDPVTQTNANDGVHALCVSEGMGYGMILAVIFAGYDAYAKNIFDGLLKLSRARPAYNMTYFEASNPYGLNFGGGTGEPTKYLMDWKLKLDTSYAGGGECAADGDMDMAMACLMAHRQWGSTGTWNYLQEAKNTIAALKKVAFSGAKWPANRRGLMYVGRDDGPNGLSRTSDYMPTHFRAFEAATGDTFWHDARINSYNTLNEAINKLSPVAKLPPGFIRNPVDADPNNFAFTPLGTWYYESPYTGIMDGNAGRVPWRCGFEHLWYGAADGTNYGAIASNICQTMKTTSGNSVNQLGYMYLPYATTYNGKTYAAGASYDNASYYDCSMAAMSAVGGCCNASHQAWVDAVWNRVTGPNGYNTTYFVGEPTLLSMLIISGNWWKPLGI